MFKLGERCIYLYEASYYYAIVEITDEINIHAICIVPLKSCKWKRGQPLFFKGIEKTLRPLKNQNKEAEITM